MEEAWKKIKLRFEEEPMEVILIASFAATAASKLINATSNARSRKTWDREVSRRERMSRRR